MPGLVARFAKSGWLVVLWGLLFLIGVLLVSTPDGVEIVNLSASC